jgi:hypothetical protein
MLRMEAERFLITIYVWKGVSIYGVWSFAALRQTLLTKLNKSRLQVVTIMELVPSPVPHRAHYLLLVFAFLNYDMRYHCQIGA